MSTIFISHVAEDADVALIIARDLEVAGHATWIYEVDTETGPSYVERVRRAVAASTALLVILSPRSLHSPQVDRELLAAVEGGKPLVPLLLDITHDDLKRRAPNVAFMVGAATSTRLTHASLEQTLPAIRAGVQALGIPRRPVDTDRIRLLDRALERPASTPPGDHPHRSDRPWPPARPPIAAQDASWRRWTAGARDRAGDLGLREVAMLALALLWLVAVGAWSAQMLHHGLAWVGVYVTPATDSSDHPTVQAYWPGTAATSDTMPRPGDRLLSVGTTDLAGAGRIDVFVAAQDERWRSPTGVVPALIDRGGTRLVTELPFVPVASAWRLPVMTGVYVFTGLFVFLRRPHSAFARAVYVGALLLALHWLWFFGGTPAMSWMWLTVFAVSSTLVFPLLVRPIAMVPESSAPPPPKYWPWLFAVFGPLVLTYVLGGPLPTWLGIVGMYVVNLVFVVAILALITRNYRNADPRGRLQIKWIYFGFYAALLPVALANAVAGIGGSAWYWLHDVLMLCEALIPLSILVAVTRANLLDIDRLLAGTTMLYSTLFVVACGGLLVYPDVTRAAVEQLVPGEASEALRRLVATIMTVALLVGALVLRAWVIVPVVDRLFRSERRRLATATDELLADLATRRDARDVLRLSCERLMTLIGVSECTGYVREGTTFRTAFTQGRPGRRAPPSTLSLDDPILSVLYHAPGVADLQVRWSTLAAMRIPPSQRHVLTRLHGEIVLGLRQGPLFLGFIVLGVRRSGEVYDPQELAHLARIADATAVGLARDDTGIDASSELFNTILPDVTKAPVHADASVLMTGPVDVLDDEARHALERPLVAARGIVDLRTRLGLTAFWDDRMVGPDHAAAACRGALALLHDAPASAPLLPVTIASGHALVGNFGDGLDVHFTARGDAADMAATLQRLRCHGSPILVSDATRRSAGSEFVFRELDRVRITDREAPLVVHELLGTVSDDLDGRLRRLEDHFVRARAEYLAGDFAEALARFERLARDYPDDPAVRLYCDRCRQLRDDPPSVPWEGICELAPRR
ncbi:MAG TPA: TIR domain-containing protein [Candidatus Binatia bacterium]|jgi:hypothetical protein|nr:TIR domain-containing protein [Candidatus Binatia bacterium]